MIDATVDMNVRAAVQAATTADTPLVESAVAAALPTAPNVGLGVLEEEDDDDEEEEDAAWHVPTPQVT